MSRQVSDSSSELQGTTAVMLKNIPSRSSVAELTSLIEDLGFGQDFSFFYMPQRTGPRHRVLNKGYAFVGFSDPDTCARFASTISGHKFVTRESTKIIEVAPARLQSNEEVMEHFADMTLNSRKAPLVVKSSSGQLEHRYAL
jgi:hypothetical protein